MRKLAAVLFACSLVHPACAEIVIGVSAPLTGPAASVSEISLPGLKQAVADINAAGGVQINAKGELLKLEILDDVCDPKQAVAVAGKLVSLRVKAVIGLSCSGSTQAAADVFEEEGVPFLAAVASLPEITQQGRKTLLRPSSRDDNDAAAISAFIAKKFPGKKIAIIHDKSTWGKGTAELIAENLKKNNFQPEILTINPGEQDYSAIISRMKQSNYDIVVPSLLMREAGLIIRQMAEQNYKPIVAGTMPLGMLDFAAITGAAREGVYFTAVSLTETGASVLKKLDSAIAPVSIYNVQAYAAVQILTQGLSRAGVKPDALLADLHSQTFKTVLGDLKFDANGDINDMQFDIMQYRGGKPVKIAP